MVHIHSGILLYCKNRLNHATWYYMDGPISSMLNECGRGTDVGNLSQKGNE